AGFEFGQDGAGGGYGELEGVDADEVGFAVVEVAEVEGDAALGGGSDFDLAATLGQELQGWLEHGSADGVEDEGGSASVGQVHDGFVHVDLAYVDDFVGTELFYVLDVGLAAYDADNGCA